MNREQAKNLIIRTFENSFNRENYKLFIKNLLKKFDEGKTFTYQGNYIPDTFKNYIASLERIGQYTDDGKEIDLLIVTLKKETSLERARTMQRNFIAWYLKGSRGGKLKDAALCAFVSPYSEDWRFSLVKMEYRFEETETGKKVKEEFTPAKRWSFLVGKNEKSHTAQSRFISILEDDNWKPTLSDLEKAFDVEVVTKEFFEKYRDLFIKTKLELDKIVKNNKKVKEEFETKRINTVDFAKKLLGQIVFLYFLQKKGWFGVPRGESWGKGPKDFIRRLFNKEFGDYENFYNDILEPLFYEALRTDRSADDHYYSRFKCKIPFLNGGLFDPINNFDWVNVDLLLPNEIFSNKNKTKEGDIGDGILDIFDRYNFTVSEEEPLEKEVALDPELLGKIYEKLNAIREDNFDEYIKILKTGKKDEETKFNREYGVYYTPREIVHYMCQESLINYLETELDGKVKKEDIEKFVKFADFFLEYERTAIEKKDKIRKGEIKKTKYNHEIPESIIENAKEIDNLLANIKICDPAVGSGAFPVGMLHQIVKLRHLLSLYLGRDTSTYDLKRHTIENSLYGVDIDPGAVEICKLRFWLSLVVDEEDFYNIKPLPNLDYKVVCGDSLIGVEKDLFNQEAFKKLEELKPKYFNETNPLKKQELKKEIDELIFQITKGNKKFDFEIYFSEVFHEKKGFDIVIANPPYGFLSGKGSPVKRFENMGKKDKANYLKEYIKKLKLLYKKSSEGCLDWYKWFIERGYYLTKPQGYLVYITPNTYIQLKRFKDIRKIIVKEMSNKIIVDLGFEIFENPIIPVAIFISQNTPPKTPIVHYCDIKEIPKPLIKQKGISFFIKDKTIKLPLSNGDIEIYKHPLAEKIYSKFKNKLKEYIEISEGEHSLNNDFSMLLNANSSNSIPVIRDDLIEKFVFASIGYLPKSYCKKYNLKLHSGERLFIRKTGDKIVATTLPPPYRFAIAHQNLYVVKKRKKSIHLKFILALLSSKLLTFLYQFGPYGQKKRIMAQLRIYGLYSLPVPKLEEIDQQPFIFLVDKIFSTKEQNSQADTTTLEQQIDQLVYKLYDLTEEEIKIVEGGK